MWSERSGVANAVVVGAFVAALAGVAVLAWAAASPAPDDEPPVIEAITNDHFVYLLGPNEIAVIDPESRETVHTIATGSNPEVVLAPDGSAVYLTDGSGDDEMLSVIDSRDWQVVAQIPSPDRTFAIGGVPSGMAVSADGRYVYIHKRKILEGQHMGANESQSSSDHWWDVFDTATQEFSDSPPHVPDCGVAQIIPPLNGSSSLAVLCYHLADLVFVDRQSGEVTEVITSRDSTIGNICARGDTSVAAAVQAPEGMIYLVTTEGCVRVIDPVAMAVTDAFALDIPADRRILYSMVALSPSGERLLLGIVPGVSSEDQGAEAWVIDVESQSLLSTFPLEPNASSLAVSPDGSLLYVVGLEANHGEPAAAPVGHLAAYDIATGEQAWRMTPLNAPEVVLVAPRP